MNRQIALAALTAILLAACSSNPARKPASETTRAPVTDLKPAGSGAASAPPATSGSGGYLAGDGPGSDAPANMDSIPDAVPRAEPLHRYANRPYTALGQKYVPLTQPGHYKERGIASWYGKKFHGQRTSIGEVYDMYGMTAAHTTLPIPSYARVTNVANHKSVIVRINDRGPFVHDRIIDLSYTAAYKLGLIGNGSGEVEVESIPSDGTLPPVVASNEVRSAPLPVEPVAAVTLPIETSGRKSAAGNVFLQLGAFKSEDGARSFLARMRAELGDSKDISLYQKDGLTRVHMGPYVSQDAARASAVKLQAKLRFKPMVSVH
ncbi:MAG TPA: septal ring lytic transglycosylase RlpA family protein [Gallionellaceae bacterium]